MEIELLPAPSGNVIARGSYPGGPDYVFTVSDDGQVSFRVVGDDAVVWAAPDAASFRRIVAVWQRFRETVSGLQSEAEIQNLIGPLRQRLAQLGALPTDRPPDPEPIFSLLLFEAEHELG